MIHRLWMFLFTFLNWPEPLSFRNLVWLLHQHNRIPLGYDVEYVVNIRPITWYGIPTLSCNFLQEPWYPLGHGQPKAFTNRDSHVNVVRFSGIWALVGQDLPH